MTPVNIWIALTIAVLATLLTRFAGAVLAASPLLRKVNEETLSRLFPLAILFCLVFKEVAASFVSPHASQGLVALWSVIAVVVLHLWWRSLFVSIIGGTALHALFMALERHLSR